MKSDMHPDYHPVVFKDGEHEIVTRSTATSEETREIDGVEHDVIRVDISAFTHPFYTGTKQLVDTEGRVDRFLERYDMEGEGELEEGEEDSDETEADEQEADEQEAGEQESGEQEADEQEADTDAADSDSDEETEDGDES